MLPFHAVQVISMKGKVFGEEWTYKQTSTMLYFYSNKLICFYVKEFITWGKNNNSFEHYQGQHEGPKQRPDYAK